MARQRLKAGLVSLVLAAQAAHAAVHVVDDDNVPCFAARYRTISEAVASAEPGDELEVCPGIYEEQVVLTKPLAVRGRPVGSQKVIVRPPGLETSRVSLLGNRAITSGILVDARRVALSHLIVDMTGAGAVGCSPLVAGIYLRAASGPVTDVVVAGAGAAAAPSCDTGLGMLVESGQVGESFGRPVFGRAAVSVLQSEFLDNEKGGLAVVGERSFVRISDSGFRGAGLAAMRVQNGIEVSRGARARIQGLRVRDFQSSTPGLVATGVLFFGAERARLKNSTLTAVQTGVFVVGDRASVLRSQLGEIAADGIVFLGSKNRALANLIATTAVSGVYVDGDQNQIRRGIISDAPIGVWFFDGSGNRTQGIEYRNVGEREEQGGVRDLTPRAVDPVTLDECSFDTDCDDGNPCTVEVCNVTAGGVCEITLLPDGSPCADSNVCNGEEVCTGGLCTAGLPLVCVDGNECTADACDFMLGCQFSPLPDGTPCTGGTCQSLPEPTCVP